MPRLGINNNIIYKLALDIRNKVFLSLEYVLKQDYIKPRLGIKTRLYLSLG